MGLLERGLVFVVLSDKLALMDVLSVSVVVAATMLILLAISTLLLFNDAELGVL